MHCQTSKLRTFPELIPNNIRLCRGDYDRLETTHPICATPNLTQLDGQPSYLAVETAVLFQGNVESTTIKFTHLFIGHCLKSSETE